MWKIFVVLLVGFLAGCGAKAADGLAMTEVVEAAERPPIAYPSTHPSTAAHTAPKKAEKTKKVAARPIEWRVIENGTFTTEFDIAQKNRTHNLDVAAKILDGTEIEPNGVFSFNEVIGLATEEKGYLPAKIFIDGKEVEGLGGGVCQLSSTLYNAAKQAGLEIVERHAHSKRVHYVPEGQDAAVAYGGVDLKIKNITSSPVRIAARIEDNKCIVEMKAKS